MIGIIKSYSSACFVDYEFQLLIKQVLIITYIYTKASIANLNIMN